jgi:hypothetical protein
MLRLSLKCQLSKKHALIFSDIVVAPFLNLGQSDVDLLGRLFRYGHLNCGTYFLAGYPDKGPRAIIKLGKSETLENYAGDIDRQDGGEAYYCDNASGFAGDILSMMHRRHGKVTTVAEVWWFRGSPDAELEWHQLMESFANQMKDDIFFVPIEAGLAIGHIDFQKPRGTDDVTMTFDVT